MLISPLRNAIMQDGRGLSKRDGTLVYLAVQKTGSLFSYFMLKFHRHGDDDVPLEREITPALNFQVSTKAVGVILVSTA
jgi:hypothetical protein